METPKHQSAQLPKAREQETNEKGGVTIITSLGRMERGGGARGNEGKKNKQTRVKLYLFMGQDGSKT